jgi:uncharacterized protein
LAKLPAALLDRIFGLPPAVSYDLEIVRDLRTPMPDGVELLGDRYRPANRTGPMPVVLIRTPYGHQTILGKLYGNFLARQGFQVFVQSVRGTFGSGGVFRPFHHEKADGLATAAWLREQPWCDGRLATAGASYLGHTQWAVAPYLDPQPAAVCLGVTTSDFGRLFYPGGSFSLFNMLSWSSMIGTQETVNPLNLLAARRRTEATDHAMSTLPLLGADTAAIGREVGYWREAIAHGEPGDEFWKPIDHSVARPNLTAPTAMVSGWYDLFLPDQLADFTALAAAGVPARLTVGPWAHADPGNIRAQLGDTVSWLAAHLDDQRTELHRAPVRLYLQHADRWLDFDQWPPAGITPTKLHLRSRGRLDWAAPGADGGSDTFRYDPADPTPSVGGPLLTGKSKQRDNRAVEARPDVLVFTGERLTRHLDLLGEVRATVHLRTEPGHADLFVRICDVDPQGVSRNVTDAIVRLRPDDPGIALDADGVRTVTVELFPTGYRFRRGHRVRVQIAAGAFPRFARNHGTGEPADRAVTGTPVSVQICHDAERPTHVELPVLSGR